MTRASRQSNAPPAGRTRAGSACYRLDLGDRARRRSMSAAGLFTPLSAVFLETGHVLTQAVEQGSRDERIAKTSAHSEKPRLLVRIIAPRSYPAFMAERRTASGGVGHHRAGRLPGLPELRSVSPQPAAATRQYVQLREEREWCPSRRSGLAERVDTVRHLGTAHDGQPRAGVSPLRMPARNSITLHRLARPFRYAILTRRSGPCFSRACSRRRWGRCLTQRLPRDEEAPSSSAARRPVTMPSARTTAIAGARGRSVGLDTASASSARHGRCAERRSARCAAANRVQGFE